MSERAQARRPASAPPIVREVLRTPGQPLDSASRAYFEPRFGADFSRIRVHHDARAAASANAIGASAYTAGNHAPHRLGDPHDRAELDADAMAARAMTEPQPAASLATPGAHIVFAPRMYQPQTTAGRALLAHELAHENVRDIGRYAMEGLTEFITRRVILRHRTTGNEQPLVLGGSYAGPYDAIQELAIAVGEPLLLRLHFQGATRELCRALGKPKFDAWTAAMDILDNHQAATQILRGPAPQAAQGAPTECT